jgi:heme-degrading monooxygenase HmoA
MITEIAQIDVKPGTEKDFEAAVAKARPLFLRAKGERVSSCISPSKNLHVTG